MGRYYKTSEVDLTHQPKDRIVPAEDADYNNVRSEQNMCVCFCAYFDVAHEREGVDVCRDC
jgi:hypothetical protein